MTDRLKEMRFQATAICPGIAIGRPFFFSVKDDHIPEFSIVSLEIDKEIERFRASIAMTIQELEDLKEKLSREGALESEAVIESHQILLKDASLIQRVELQIRKDLKNAESVFRNIIKEVEQQFAELDDPYFRERFEDVADVSRRVLKNLKKKVTFSLANIPYDSIVFAKELSPSDTAEADARRVIAFVTHEGGKTSHAAIIAKSKGVPFITGINYDLVSSLKSSMVIVDGKKGLVFFDPDPQTLLYYKNLQRQIHDYLESIKTSSASKTQTEDGHPLRLCANVEGFTDLDDVQKIPDCGIGLFRSEYLCNLSSRSFPDEETQYQAYAKLLETMKDRSVVIRAFDVGGDKFSDLLTGKKESNPFLGCRGIRFMLKEKDIFKKQLRALLRASVHGQLKILFPMISSVQEWRSVKKYLDEVKLELLEEKIPFDRHIRIGCMIEVPSAALTCDLIARECDFLSIGTNDLVQYTLAVDRGNESLGDLYDPFDPSVIRLLKLIVTEGRRCGIPVSVCGEVAADPLFIPILLAIGVQELSVAIRHIPLVKKTIQFSSMARISLLTDELLTLSSSEEIKKFITTFLEKETFLENESKAEKETFSLL